MICFFPWRSQESKWGGCSQTATVWVTWRFGGGRTCIATPLPYSCLENPKDRGAWQAAVHGVTKSRTWLSDFTFHFHALEKEMATHSSVLAWRIPGMAEPGGLPSMGSHRVRHNWSDLAAAAAAGSACRVALVVSDYLWPYSFVACQAPLSMGFSKQEYPSGLPFFLWPRDWSHISSVSCIGRWVLYHEHHLGSPGCRFYFLCNVWHLEQANNRRRDPIHLFYTQEVLSSDLMGGWLRSEPLFYDEKH